MKINNNMLYKSKILSIGSYLPENIVTNDDISKMVNTSDEWIFQRTGIKERRIISKGEGAASISIKAAEDALKNSNLTSDDIDGVILATATPDFSFPATATFVSKSLNIRKGFAYDINVACAGFIFALQNADNAIRLGQASNILVIGCDVFSNIMDWSDRNTCVLFGDGAGAVIVSKTESENNILSTHVFTNSQYCDESVSYTHLTLPTICSV